MSSSTTDQQRATVPGTSGTPVPPKPRFEAFLLFLITAGLIFIAIELLNIIFKSQKQSIQSAGEDSKGGVENSGK